MSEVALQLRDTVLAWLAREHPKLMKRSHGTKGNPCDTIQPTFVTWGASPKNGPAHQSPIYDVQYWAQWSQPYGLLRIARLLEKLGYKRRELFDFMGTSGEKRTVSKRRIAPGKRSAPSGHRRGRGQRHRPELLEGGL